MFPFPFSAFNFQNSVIVILILMLIIKLYIECTKGVCKSTKRLDGKTIIITGANTGIGKETALDLASRGGRIILACRDLKKASLTKDDIVQKSGNCNVLVKKLDLASLASVRQFAKDVLENEPKLHLLINNAGCGGNNKQYTQDGLENQMQSNYFGHFLLTNLLLGLMIKTAENEQENVRIINVSSDISYFCRSLNFEDLNFVQDRTAGTFLAPYKIYGTSKLCNILFSMELANKLEHHGNAITVNSLHPGSVYTEFGRFSSMFSAMMIIGIPFLKTPKEGAQTTIYLAVADEVANVTAQYFRDCKIATPSKLAQDSGMAKKLWDVSETLVHLQSNEKFF
ncbi:retinol dehydrogenase 11-like [Daphnia carinata]|uniref:retinol dehydrogenase 11-like n=1 Tax=Daphnia carinata TaxID=120202 RepID=UPI00257A7660|nr:retinol dehydrogenase 11-like [Daphnia carinata]